MYLENAGIRSRDAQEIRFLCTERFKAQKVLWHFKSLSKDIIDVAFKGSQTSLKVILLFIQETSIKTGYVELKPPSVIADKGYAPKITNQMMREFNKYGQSSNGGFTTTAFGSDQYQAFWTVKGDDPAQAIYECATQHKVTGGNTSPADSPNMVYTHHSIWFRGSAPTEEEARNRLLNK